MYITTLQSTPKHSPALSIILLQSPALLLHLLSYVNYKYVDLIKITSLLTGVLCDTYSTSRVVYVFIFIKTVLCTPPEIL